MDSIGLAVVLTAFALLLAMAFTNGFNDASAVMATLIASGAARPRRAVVLAAITICAGVLLGGAAVAKTVAGLVSVPASTAGTAILAAALAGAVGWNLIAVKLGLPSSTSHALVGGLVGATVVAYGPSSVNWGASWVADPLHRPFGGVAGVVASMLLSPGLGFVAGFAVQRAARFALRGAHVRVNRSIKRLQYVTNSLLAFAHGSNVGQKSIGLFVLLLVAGGIQSDASIPLYAVALVAFAITLGTLGGGWPIVKTLARRIFEIEPIHALDSQLACAAVVLGATATGGPVATTHVVAASLMGVGAAGRFSDVRWSVAKRILQGWVITIPSSAVIAGAIAAVLRVGGAV